jgi:hypothetical protein
MKVRIPLFLSLFLAVLPLANLRAQIFPGTNAPGTGTNFTFTVGAGATNLSLVVSNNASTYSYLLVKLGGAPTDTVFDFASRLNGQTNQINLEAPQFALGSYGLRVSTPAASTTDPFQVVMTTNRTDLRSAGYPVLKPLAFSTTGFLTNNGSGAWHYFQVDVPSNLLTGWRIVLSTNSPGGNPDLYVRRGAIPTTGSYDQSSVGQVIDTITFLSGQVTNGTYFIGVYLPAGPASSSTYTLSTELASVTTITWDPGTTDAGTQVFTNLSATGGDYFFAITSQNTANQVWRTALNVQSGEADVYLRFGSLPTVGAYNYASTRVGSDGFVLSQLGGQFAPGQNWYLLVHATPGAQWNLVTGEAYVQQLPQLAADASSGATVTMGAEGMHFFKTTISTNTLAWRLGLNGLGNQMYVKQTAAPHPYNTATYDLTQPGQMLVVPTYLTIGNQYFVGVVGNPGLVFTLDSRQQPVVDLAFNTVTNFSVTGFGYATFRVQVPIQQIAWQITATPISGTTDVAVRENNVPNEFVNDAFSEVAGSIGSSVTLVPTTLSDGTWYVTVYGNAPYTCSLTNGNPVITDVHYVFNITNDAPNRVGWRFYRVVNTAEQLGSLGWELDLSNQVAGSEIAIRRNAVPGRWNYRNNPFDYYGYSTLGYVDLSGILGFLQQPNHPADIWYIGVYTPNAALGSFVLTGSQLTGPPVQFDGAGNSINVTNQPVGKLKYFSFTVPPGAFGWDLRITNTTSGSPGFAICRDQLPYDLGTHTPQGYGWGPASSTTWPSGYQWGAAYDWTSDYYDANGDYRYAQVLQMGMSNPLEPGTYYVGVLNTGGPGNGNPMSYTLVSRGIGTGFAIPVGSLSFSNGVVSNPSLPGREVAYYSIVVPTNLPTWRLELGTNVGESLLMLQKDYLPNVAAGGAVPYSVNGGRKLQKAGNEQYLLMPANGQINIVAGTYYLAVASEGMNPTYPSLGTNASSYTLTSYGVLSISNIGTVDASGVTDILVTNSSPAGQLRAFQFSVPPGTLSMEVHLENHVGNPMMLLRADNQLSGGYDGYGVDGGQGYTWANQNLINLVNPTPTNYTLMVQAIASGGDASYRIRIHALGSLSVAFNGGTSTIVNQPPGTWQFFTITVPAGAFGWDLRITNATSGSPGFAICRDLAPYDLGTHTSQGYGWGPASSTTWPSGYQWGAAYDWTSDYNDANGTYRYAQVLQMGMSNPLEPGNYIIGVINDGGPGNANPMSYTLVSRGIGTGFAIPVGSLSFSNGVVSNPSLAGREVAYYSIVVPTNLPTWRLELGTNVGESLLMLQKDYLPNVAAGGAVPYSVSGGRKLQKAGNEQYLLMPAYGQSNIVAGTYYLAVASEGVNPNYPYLGSNASSFSLTSYGVLVVTNIGTVDPTGVTDILVTNSSRAGQLSAFQFNVPPNTLSMQVFLESRVGNPMMLLRIDNQLTGGYDGYGVDGGQGYTWANQTLINIANPVVTNYTLMVQAIASGGDASYRIRIHALGPQPVAFDGGNYTIANQPSGTWQYFSITVPPGAMGWDLRITNTTSGSPGFAVCRDITPTDLGTHTDLGYGWGPASSTTWPTGYQWGAAYDWTGDYADANGAYRYGQVLQMGMGNPLQPGNFIVGVFNNGGPGNANPMSYTLVSRGIGPGFAIPVGTLTFSNGVVSNPSLLARETAYYSIVVPTNLPNWKLRLTSVSGESLLAFQKDYLPSVAAAGSPPFTLNGGRKLQKAGNEQYLMLPAAGQSNIVSGTYYLLVASEGMNPNYPYIGTNGSSFTLNSYGVQPVTNLGPIGVSDIYRTNSLQGGENALYQFSIPNGAPAVEVRLDNVTGGPYMTLQTGTNIPSPYYGYGFDGGVGSSWSSPTIITLPNPTVTNYSLTEQASYLAGNLPDSIATLHIRQMQTPLLTFDASLNGGGFSNIASGTLLNGQSAYYKIVVPATLNSQPVIGWKLDVTQTSGTPRIRIRPGFLPDDYDYYDGTSPFVTTEAIIVGPYLTPGTWFIEVRGTGLTSYTLTSSNLRLKRPAWNMPALGQSVSTPGLPASGPLFADTGMDTNGVPLPADQGTDLAQGAFDYYAITVPPTNTGIIRTRLDAISGNPNLFIRVAAPSTLSHYQYGNYGATLYDRSMNASGGSEYGNWVPFNGRYEAYLTNGTWYLAVQAGGNSNVRYRLRSDYGSISNLVLNGGSYANQLVAAGDWLYYAVQLPTNAPLNWNVTLGVQLGNLVMYVRDRVPPGEATTITDYRDWSNDSKNHGPYPTFSSPGTYTLNTPPLRPGNTYYLGLRAITDSTFSLSSATNSGTIDWSNTVAFYGGVVVSNVPAFGVLKLRIDVPVDARRLALYFTNVSAFSIYLDQGSVPTRTTSDHWYSIGSANPSLNQALYNANGWPWLPGYMYYLFVTNNTASPQTFAMSVDGRNCATDDYDADGLPDCWEVTYFPSIYSYGPNDDPDADGVRNLDEYLEGTDPTNPLSFHPRLLVTSQFGTVNLSPPGNPTTTPPKVWYNLGQPVQLTPSPSAGYNFVGWSGDASGTANPLTVIMNGHSNIVALFALTNQPNADYQFQNNLHSSVGTPPDLSNIAAGNTFVSSVVDGNSRTVYRFPVGSSVELLPADGVIPTNIYTMVMLFSFDNISGYRRILDVKNPPSDYNLYDINGQLQFYPVVTAPTATMAPSNYVQVVITRDASSNMVAYVNGVQQFSFVDSALYGTLAGSPQMLRFFKDNASEDAAGTVARIRLYDKVMPPFQVAGLDRLPGGPAAPRFLTPYVSGGVLNLPAQLTPGYSYRLLASPDLINWTTISTTTPGSSPFTFTDPLGPIYPTRFYRLVTP